MLNWWYKVSQRYERVCAYGEMGKLARVGKMKKGLKRSSDITWHKKKPEKTRVNAENRHKVVVNNKMVKVR